MKRRILAWAMCLTMLVSMLPTPAFATEADTGEADVAPVTEFVEEQPEPEGDASSQEAAPPEETVETAEPTATVEPANTDVPQATDDAAEEAESTPEATAEVPEEPQEQPTEEVGEPTPEESAAPDVTEAPEVMAATLSAEPAHIFLGDTIYFAVNVTGEVEGELTTVFTVTPENITDDNKPETATAQATKVGYEPKQGGAYTVSASVTDEAGHTAVATASFTVAVHDTESTGEWTHIANEAALAAQAEQNDLRHILLAVAKSQLDYSASAIDYIFDGDEQRFFTVYGYLTDAAYEPWSASFASFCLAYAGVPEDVLAHESDVSALLDDVKALGVYHEYNADYTPEPGDLVFYTVDEEQRVAIVSSLEGGLHAIGADLEANEVAEFVLENDQLVGFASTLEIMNLVSNLQPAAPVEPEETESVETPAPAETPAPTEEPAEPEETGHPIVSQEPEATPAPEASEEPEATEEPEASEEPEVTEAPEYFCGLTEHTHGDDCYDDTGALTCELPEHVHNETCLTPAEPEPTEAPVYYCGQEEHTHTDECYDETGALICG